MYECLLRTPGQFLFPYERKCGTCPTNTGLHIITTPGSSVIKVLMLNGTVLRKGENGDFWRMKSFTSPDKKLHPVIQV